MYAYPYRTHVPPSFFSRFPSLSPSQVKAVHCTLLHSRDGTQTREAIISVSRDSMARVWTREVGPAAERAGWVEGPTFDGGGRYLNAVVVVPPRDDKENGECATVTTFNSTVKANTRPLPFLAQPPS